MTDRDPDALADAREWLNLLRPHRGSEFGVIPGRGELETLMAHTYELCRLNSTTVPARLANRWLHSYTCQLVAGFYGGPLLDRLATACADTLGVSAPQSPHSPWQGRGGPHRPDVSLADATGISDADLLVLLRDEVPDDSGFVAAVGEIIEASRPDRNHAFLATDPGPMALLAIVVDDYSNTPAGSIWTPGPLLCQVVDAMAVRATSSQARSQYSRLRLQLGLGQA